MAMYTARVAITTERLPGCPGGTAPCSNDIGPPQRARSPFEIPNLPDDNP